ncbi:hypothetical protein SAMN04487864_101393 [Succiniclasticum ruminis]|uniref:Dolichyl-phosphate-mannose-protein mannosyltransferase n=1 Tax=Succiniclasticum ruminis TaxID=40841 RepID=A0A1G6I1V3_9FIRM|nr:hypothetical protein SAMN04487864_101393 [Succiniclasticum ruminis]
MSLQHIVSICYLCFILLFIFFIRPSNSWHHTDISEIKPVHNYYLMVTLIATVMVAVLPMSLSPYWNGTIVNNIKKQEYRNGTLVDVIVYNADKQQYDRLGDALLNGHLYIDNGKIDPALENMENPYDAVLREKLGVAFNWDEAYYNHHYYMYFGPVPTLLLFIPFKLLTRTALLAYQATQVFAGMSIVGLFYLLYILAVHFFKKLPFSVYLVLSVAFSVLSIGYSIAAPALYCTAIVSAVCLMIWSIIFFIKGAWLAKDENISKIYLFVGGFLGALAFGCRPPVALANLLVLSVIAQIVKKQNAGHSDKTKKLVLLLLPYFFVGITLMLYNYARFDNAFEFGQSYQLTVTDQHQYGSFIERFNMKTIVLGCLSNFYAICPLSERFPFVWYNGTFISFPILLFSVKVLSKSISSFLKERGLNYFSILMFLIPFIITIFDSYWAPYLLERYRLDFYFLLCIASFIAIGALLEIVSEKKKKILLCSIILLSFAVFAIEFLFFCIPVDGSYTLFYPEVLDAIYKGLRFGL